MRLPRVRYTLRRMMAALAVVALICWAGRFLLVSAMYHARAREFSFELMSETPIWMGPKDRPRVYTPPAPACGGPGRWGISMSVPLATLGCPSNLTHRRQTDSWNRKRREQRTSRIDK